MSMSERYVHKHWERDGRVKLATYTDTGEMVMSFVIDRADMSGHDPLLDPEWDMISAADLLHLQQLNQQCLD
jgi:hypothetical protein